MGDPAGSGSDILTAYKGGTLVWIDEAVLGFDAPDPQTAPDLADWTVYRFSGPLTVNAGDDLSFSPTAVNDGYYITVDVAVNAQWKFEIRGSTGSGAITREIRVGTLPGSSDLALLSINSGDWQQLNSVLFTPTVDTVYCSVIAINSVGVSTWTDISVKLT